jgi:hypothetical protein
MQVLPDGNVVCGWGNNAYVTEHLEDGTPVFYGWIAKYGTMIYRVYKGNWTAEPLTSPNLWSFSKVKETTVFYVSWNGATEVTHWQFYISADRDGEWKLATKVEKSGFETMYTYTGYAEWVYVEALHNDVVLKKSNIERTFVPGPDLVASCNDFGCATATPPEEEENPLEENPSEEKMHPPTVIALSIVAISGVLLMIGLTLVMRKTCRRRILSWLTIWQDSVSEVKERSMRNLELWRGRYQRVGNG